MKYIVALNKKDKEELDLNDFKFVTKEFINNNFVFIYENDLSKLDTLSNKTNFLFTDILFI